MKYTKESLLEILKQKAQELGRTPSSVELGIHPSTICAKFGNMSKFIELAGLLPYFHTKKKAEILERKCPTCQELFSAPKWRDKKFCGTRCSNISRRNPNSIKKDPHSRKEWLISLREEWKQKPFEYFGWEGRRKRVIEEQNSKCNRCELSEWQGEKLSLEVDHKNGDRNDHRRENLEGLCPNCHSLTPTWRGKNLNRERKISDEELKSALEKTPNICQGLILVGMSPRGANYVRAKRLMKNEPIV